MTAEPIIAGLIGSIVTVVATKVLEMVQGAREHRYSLEKAFFDGKLEAAQSLVSQISQIIQSLSTFRLLSEADLRDRLPFEVYKGLHDTFFPQWQTIGKQYTSIANLMMLYFPDGEMAALEKTGGQRLIAPWLSFMQCASTLTALYAAKDALPGAECDFLDKRIAEVEPEMNASLRSFLSVSQEAERALSNDLVKMRADMRAYDPVRRKATKRR
jgi:hypothetical protein